MAIKKYYDSDCNLGVLDGKTVAVIGFGSQGHAHSENLAESGVNVVVGLRKGSAHWEKASEFAATHENFKVMEVEEAAKAGDVVMMLVPDELCADIYNKQVAPYMTEGKALAFAHGFNIHFKTITAPKNVDVIMIAPKGPGHIVRRLKETGAGAITMAKRKRDMQLNFRVSAEELAVIEQKMSQFGTSNREAYLRKMALDGYVVKLELPELKELVSLMRRSSNNLNQLTRKVHETGRVYDADLEDISQRQEQLWEGVKEILTQLSKLL